MAETLMRDVLILLALSVVGVALFRRLNLPPILGYLLVGLVAGPHAMGWLEDTHATHFLGEIGVVFLLFTIGLEFSLAQFWAMRNLVLGLGGSQVVLGTAAAGGVAWMAGMGVGASLVVGGALALSSTALVVKQLTEQLELHSPHGRVAFGILLFQDLAVVPFLVIIPLMAGDGGGMLTSVLWALGQGVLAVAFMLAVGRWAVRPIFREVARAHSGELFTLTALLAALAAAWATHEMGLSLALGAFLAGLMLGETEFRHQVEADIRPFRDVLLGLFFITIGMQLDLSLVPSQWQWVGGLLLLLLVGKLALVAGLTRLAGYPLQTASRTGIVLAQGGEFGFALMALAISQGLFSGDAARGVLTAAVLSMALAPLLIRYNGPLVQRLVGEGGLLGGEERGQELEAAGQEVEGHTILCGFGRVGQNLARFLREVGFDYVALDLDPMRVREAREGGEWVFYGNSTDQGILEAAGIHHASSLVVTFNEPARAERVVDGARRLRPDLPILVRTRDEKDVTRLSRAGATEVFPETLEASLMLGAEMLLALDVPSGEVMQLLESARTDSYRHFRGMYQGTEDAETTGSGSAERVQTVVLPAGAKAVGRRLGELGLTDHGVLVLAVRRRGIRGEQPSGDLTLHSGDVLVLQGEPEATEWAEKRLLSGPS
jgi:CPA2 family monovalent cation:H+ antiporter-2